MIGGMGVEYLDGDYGEEIGTEMTDRDFYDNFGYGILPRRDYR